LEYKLSAISMFPEFAQTGGLLAYGQNPIDLYRQAGTIVGKVLAGTAPVERPARFQLVINLRTTRALGYNLDWSTDPRRRGDRIAGRVHVSYGSSAAVWRLRNSVRFAPSKQT
jgi:ABC-type uncharacterized transport system substrate-binding protein